MSRFAIAWLRVLGSLGAGAAAWTTFWLIRGGEPGPAAYIASLAAALAVYVASTNPPPRPWGDAPDVGTPAADAPPAVAPAPTEPAEAPGPLR